MRVLVTGATGYIGGRVIPRLLELGHEVRCFSRSARRLTGRFGNDVEIVEGEIDDDAALVRALAGVDVAYYLVHMMLSRRHFGSADREAARRFSSAAARCGVKKIVYLGGLGDDGDELSAHLRSRHEVGDMLREGGVPVIEFRAAQIIGSGSLSFEMLRYLTERLPVMIAPRWVQTRCQPIGIRDVLNYLLAALDAPAQTQVYEIGGRDVLTYKDMMETYAHIRGLRRSIIVVPFFTPRLSSYWVHFVTPVPARVAQPLIQGLHNEVIVHDDRALRDFSMRPAGFAISLQRALDRYSSLGPETTWFDAFDVRTIPDDFTGSKEGMLIDARVRQSTASAQQLADVFASLGGTRGWLSADWLWRIRGWMERWAGGVGLRRGRRSQYDLHVGDAVDFWRVEAYVPGQLLRLRAEMKLPGRAWLQFEAEPQAQGSLLRQTAFFEPRGLFGYLYWYAVALFHQWIFARMATKIAAEASLRGR